MSQWFDTMGKETKMPTRLMPDVANDLSECLQTALDWVGMSDIEVPLLLVNSGHPFRVPARAQAYVSLDDPKAKGIHMSRLFLNLQETIGSDILSPKLVKKALEQFLHSHTGISQASFLKLSFDYMIERPALVSANRGWRTYPAEVIGRIIDGDLRLELSVKVIYSSTCPCSAALARQLIQEQFEKDFGSQNEVNVAEVKQWLGSPQGVVATPHSQRSEAWVKVLLSTESLEEFPILHLINLIEDTLKTAVQAAVKREDEQEFARLNGQNPMFCEDAARKIKHALHQDTRFKDFWLQARHIESLHPHDAVSVATKGVAGGYGDKLV